MRLQLMVSLSPFFRIKTIPKAVCSECLQRHPFPMGYSTNNYRPAQKQTKILQKLIKGKVIKKKSSANDQNPKKTIAESVPEMTSILGTLRTESLAQRRRRDVLNKLFMSHVTDIMAMESLSQPLLGLGIQVTKVEVSRDFQTLAVHWFVADRQQVKTVSEKLKMLAKEIRGKLISLNVLGRVPHLIFVEDKNNSRLLQLEEALAKANLGLDDLEEGVIEPTMDPEDFNENYISIDRLNPTNPTGDSDRKCSGVTFDLNNPALKADDMRQDILGLNHFALWDKLMENKKNKLQRKELIGHQSSFLYDSYEKPERANTKSDSEKEDDPENRKKAMQAFIKSRKYHKSASKATLKEKIFAEVGKLEMEERVTADFQSRFPDTEIEFHDEEEEENNTKLK